MTDEKSEPKPEPVRTGLFRIRTASQLEEAFKQGWMPIRCTNDLYQTYLMWHCNCSQNKQVEDGDQVQSSL